MKPRGTAQRSSRAAGKGKPPQHIPSHARLLHDVSRSPAPSTRSRLSRPDAFVVPATRPASALTGLIELAAGLETLLVVLCSRQANVEQVAERVGRIHRARALVVQVDEDYRLPGYEGFETSSDAFIAANGGRASDLSLKRNFGLLLARLLGWTKLVFVDDDITVRRQDIARLTAQLDSHQIASMVCRHFPDNSVFCHARRLARLPQDVFATGAVLGVNCSDLPLPFFPDIYNEDWFFFGDAAARRRLTKVGEAVQLKYDPFAEPARAEHEEFGDLLAEGLYALIEMNGPGHSFRQVTHHATERYWSSYIDVRRHDLTDTRSRLDEFASRHTGSDEVAHASKSLEAAESLYGDGMITAERCVQFLEAWQADMVGWGRTYSHTNNLGNIRDAMDWLQTTTFQTVR
jgi:hypothetical protein